MRRGVQEPLNYARAIFGGLFFAGVCDGVFCVSFFSAEISLSFGHGQVVQELSAIKISFGFLVGVEGSCVSSPCPAIFFVSADFEGVGCGVAGCCAAPVAPPKTGAKPTIDSTNVTSVFFILKFLPFVSIYLVYSYNK